MNGKPPERFRAAGAPPPPAVPYHGSKRRLLGWIAGAHDPSSYDSVIDLMGGSGAVSHAFKAMRKEVTYNDILPSNWRVGDAIVRNGTVTLGEGAASSLARPPPSGLSFVRRTFGGVYYTDAENAWLDDFAAEARRLRGARKSLALAALWCCCVSKRPFGLFHRANLGLRLADVPRRRPPKPSWDRGFPEHFRAYAAAMDAAVFDSGRRCRATNLDAARCPRDADLAYLDPPYSARDDYADNYHFLTGYCAYADGKPWEVDRARKHLPLPRSKSEWNDPDRAARALERVASRHSASLFLMSYSDRGDLARAEVEEVLGCCFGSVRVEERSVRYPLRARDTTEMLFACGPKRAGSASSR